MTDPVKERISQILGLPSWLANYWFIRDIYPRESDPELVLIHHGDWQPGIRSQDPLLDLRGIIVDYKKGVVVCRGYGYSKRIVAHGLLEETSEEYQIPTLVDQYNYSEEDEPQEVPQQILGVQRFSKRDTLIFPGSEGTIVRFFKWKGKVFFSTYKKIEGEYSRWGNRDTFGNNFDRLVPGFNPEDLFGPEEYSPYTFVFLIMDINTRIVSASRANRVHFLSIIKTWEEKDHPEYLLAGQTEILCRGVPNLQGPEPGIFSGEQNKPLRFQPVLNVKIVNKILFPRDLAVPIPEEYQDRCLSSEMILEYSQTENTVKEVYFKSPENDPTDLNLGGGDMVIIYNKEPNGRTRVYELVSPGFLYRDNITGGDPNFYHNFVIRMEMFMTMSTEELRETFPLYDVGPLDIPENRRKWWLRILYDAVCPDYKDRILGFLDTYQKDIRMVANFILRGGMGVTIGPQSQQRFANLLKTIQESPGRDRMTSLVSLLYRETGNSIYKMIQEVQKAQRITSTNESVTLPSPTFDLSQAGRFSFRQ